MYRDPMMEELEATRALRVRAWREVCGIFNVRAPQPRLKVVEGPLYMVHQNFIAGGAYSSIPMFLRYDGSAYTAEFYRPVVAVNPYVYYFEGVASRWTPPILASAIVHEYAHIAFPLSAGLHFEFVRRAVADLRLAMQLPFLTDEDLRSMREASVEVEALMEAPALWAEEEVCSRLKVPSVAERRLMLQAARDEELRRLMAKHDIAVEGPSARVRVEAMMRHWRAVKGASLRELVDYVDGALEELVGRAWRAIKSELGSRLKVSLREEEVEAPAVMGRTIEWLWLWKYFLKEEFGHELLKPP